MKIQELTIYTSRLSEQKQFYPKTLGLTIINESNNEVLFNIGYSSLRLIKREGNTPYHFAFNIPSNKEEDALGKKDGKTEYFIAQ